MLWKQWTSLSTYLSAWGTAKMIPWPGQHEDLSACVDRYDNRKQGQRQRLNLHLVDPGHHTFYPCIRDAGGPGVQRVIDVPWVWKEGVTLSLWAQLVHRVRGYGSPGFMIKLVLSFGLNLESWEKQIHLSGGGIFPVVGLGFFCSKKVLC